MKTKTQFKQEMRKYFREAVDKAVGETFTSWFDNLWASLVSEMAPGDVGGCFL